MIRPPGGVTRLPNTKLLQRLSRFLDRPGFPWKKLIVGFQLGQYVFESFLSFRQYQILKAKKPPQVLAGEIKQETFDKSQAYGRAKAKYGFWSGLYSLIPQLAIVYYDVMPKVWDLTGVWLVKYVPERFAGEIVHSLIFLFAFTFVGTIVDLPFQYYYHFVLEEKFGFNKQTVKLWVTDLIKGQALMIVFGAPLLSGFLAIIQETGNNFFAYLWLFSVVVQVFAITIYPIAILPLFNKLTPLEPGSLKTGVEDLAKKLQFPLSELHVIDGSKRSAHSNAYFYGLPWKKHIVIFDTLIEKSDTEEVIAVLGHELGHWKLGHTTKLFAISQFHIFYLFTLFSVFINNRSLYQSYGFYNEFPIIVGFMLFSDALSPLDTVVKLLLNILSRIHEFQAGESFQSHISSSMSLLTTHVPDQFAAKLGYSQELGRSLLRLQIQNLSTMDADWMYASYHFSHPILSERLGALNWKAGEKANGKEADSEKPVKAADREL